MTAHQLREVDKSYEMHLQAWVNQQVKATKGKGKNTKSAYKTFKDFYDYEKQRRKVHGAPREEETPQAHTLRAMIMDYNKS